MRLTHRARLASIGVLVAAGAIACASVGTPPGGPEDAAGPVVLAIRPESGAVNVTGREIEVRFNEVIAEGGPGALAGFVVVSPSIGEPRVTWRRDRITVRARDPLAPNTAYRVTILPGVTDLSGNKLDEPVSVVFSTGAAIPNLGIVGRVFDWVAERPVAGAFVQAIARPTPDDSATIYQAYTDSVGQFEIGPLGPGRYDVRTVIDANRNRIRDPLEKWDSRSIEVTNVRPSVELLAIERDTTAPRLTGVIVEDSLTLRLQLDDFVDPDLVLTTASVMIRRADSSAVAITNVIAAGQLARQRTDSIARADSIRSAAVAGRLGGPPAPVVPPPPRPAIRPPSNAIIVRLAAPLTPGRYVAVVRDLRNLRGQTATSEESFEIRPR